MAILKPITKAGFIVYAEGVDLFWTTFSGINDTAETGTYANQTGNRIFKVVGPRTLEDMELSSPYDPVLAQQAEEFWLNYQCQFLTITIQPVLCDGEEENGPPYIIEGAQLSSLNVAEVDRESGDVAMITLSFTANSWRRG